MGPPRGEAGGRGCPSTAGAPVPPPSLQTVVTRHCGGSPKAWHLEGPAPRDPQAGLRLAHAHPNSTGSKAASGCVSAPPGHCPRRAHTYHTHTHTQRALGHVTGCITRGHHHNWTRDFRRRRLLPLALRLRRSAQGLALGPPAEGVRRGSLLQGDTRVPGAGSVASTGACDSAEETVLRKAELCLKPEPTGTLSKRDALKCVQ